MHLLIQDLASISNIHTHMKIHRLEVGHIQTSHSHKASKISKMKSLKGDREHINNIQMGIHLQERGHNRVTLINNIINMNIMVGVDQIVQIQITVKERVNILNKIRINKMIKILKNIKKKMIK